jgi:hypothetical protein
MVLPGRIRERRPTPLPSGPIAPSPAPPPTTTADPSRTGVEADRVFVGADPSAPCAAPTRGREPSILYLGLNPGAPLEVRALRARVGPRGVEVMGTPGASEVVTGRSQRFALDREPDRLRFAAAVGLSGPAARTLETFLADAPEALRDEWASLAWTFAAAERGERSISRLILSAHSSGEYFWGEAEPGFSAADLGRLVALFPTAARQIEDVMIAACFSGGPSRVDRLRAIFPRVRSIWAYAGSAPGAASGATTHLLRWERATRGRGGDALDRDVARGTRKGESVAVWTVTHGYDDGRPPEPLAAAESRAAATRFAAADHLAGARTTDDPSRGPLRTHYDALQRLLGRVDLPLESRAHLARERDHTLRLLFWHRITAQVDARDGAATRRALAEAELDPRGFAGQSVAEVRARVDALDAWVETHPSASREARVAAARLRRALVDLAPELVPVDWL